MDVCADRRHGHGARRQSRSAQPRPPAGVADGHPQAPGAVDGVEPARAVVGGGDGNERRRDAVRPAQRRRPEAAHLDAVRADRDDVGGEERHPGRAAPSRHATPGVAAVLGAVDLLPGSRPDRAGVVGGDRQRRSGAGHADRRLTGLGGAGRPQKGKHRCKHTNSLNRTGHSPEKPRGRHASARRVERVGPAASAPSRRGPTHPSAIARLRALLDVTRLVRDETDTATVLNAIAEFDRDLARLPHRRRQHLPAGMERLRGDDRPRQRPGQGDAPRRHPAVGGLGAAARRALRRERRLHDPPRRVRLGGDVGARYIPDWEPSASPDLAPRRRAVRADAAHGRPPARHHLGRRARLRPAPVRGRAGRPRRGRRSCRARAPERPGDGRCGVPSRRAAPAPAGVVAADQTLSAGTILQSVCEGISEALGFDKVCIDLPDLRYGHLHHPCRGRLDARRHAPELADDAVGAGAAARPPFERQGCYLLTLDEALARLRHALDPRAPS